MNSPDDPAAPPPGEAPATPQEPSRADPSASLPPATPKPLPEAPRRKRSRKLLFIGGALAAAVALALFLFVGPWLPRSRAEGAEPVDVVIEQGDSLSRAAEKLEQAGVISSAGHFKLLARIVGGGSGVKVGEYAFFPSDGWSQHFATLTSGRSIQRLVVIPEGMPSVLVHERLMKTDLLTGEIPVPAEGSILPSSYDYRRGEARSAVVARMQEGMRRELARLWAQRSPNSVVKSPEEAIILASIVEKETGNAKERPMVAGALSNRLRIGMMLGADATTIYPITRGRPLGRMIRVSELRDRNPYNTRAVGGLPPGPITNPGRESIAAVLDPAQTDALYYVADGSGGHVFSRTLEEHEANAERWRAIRRQRGEM